MLPFVRRPIVPRAVATRMMAALAESSSLATSTPRIAPRASLSVKIIDACKSRFANGVAMPALENARLPTLEATTPTIVSAAKTPRYRQPGYQPLSVLHPAFGQLQAHVGQRRRQGEPLSTVHPAFGTKPAPLAQHLFRGPIGISGFFLAVDPNLALGPLRSRNRLNPNAQLTIRDHSGNSSRVRYRCQLEAVGGLHVEAMVRFQVGWISPRVTFAEVPNVIHLGRGFDVSLPFLFHFTMVSVLDEHGCATGSSLYFSGTPMFGLSIGYSLIQGGKLIIDPRRELDPTHETAHHFIGHVHYRQIGFVVFKVGMWILFTLACIPPVRRWIVGVVPNPLYWYSEAKVRE